MLANNLKQHWKEVVTLQGTRLRHCHGELWHRGVVVITTAQLHSTKPALSFCAGSNPARSVSEINNGEDLTMVPVGNKAKRLSLVNDTTIAIHHHEVHGKVKLGKGQKKLTFSATQKDPSKKKVKAIVEKI